MTQAELGVRLTNELKSYLKQTGHNDTGKLYNSINFTVNKSGISLKTMDYILFLDEGELLDNFFNKDSVKNILATYYTDIITDKIKKLGS